MSKANNRNPTEGKNCTLTISQIGGEAEGQGRRVFRAQEGDPETAYAGAEERKGGRQDEEAAGGLRILEYLRHKLIAQAPDLLDTSFCHNPRKLTQIIDLSPRTWCSRGASELIWWLVGVGMW